MKSQVVIQLLADAEVPRSLQKKKNPNAIMRQARDLWNDDTSFNAMQAHYMRQVAEEQVSPTWDSLNEKQQRVLAYILYQHASDRNSQRKMASQPARAIGTGT